MSTTANPATETPVFKSITVKADPDHAFRVFTADIDSWWPRTHHIGKAPMKRVIIEGRPGGRCYTEQTDGSEADWGEVLVWDPPQRLVLAWKITHEWGYQPDLARSSEVEVRFSPVPGGSTRVDLEHRHFERLGAGSASMRTAVSSEGGWSGVLKLFAERADSTASR
jgi:uncharacterized protein YndB with AHSA1/START domain